MLNIYELCNQDLGGRALKINRQQVGGREDGRGESHGREERGKKEGHMKEKKEGKNKFPLRARIVTSLRAPKI